jgi:L-ascorbate metabolism protein UlaG (beta-lactamase superfamily)
VLAPRGARALLDSVRGDLGDRCTELAPGDAVQVGGVRVEAVPAAHDGRRHPWSRHSGPALGFVLTGTRRTWFAGDTDLWDGMAGLGPVDLALIPVGGWGPTLGEGHLDPVTAAEAAARCGAGTVVPIHWGTLWPIGLGRVRGHLFSGPGPRFAAAMAERGLDAAVHVLEPGQSLELDQHHRKPGGRLNG